MSVFLLTFGIVLVAMTGLAAGLIAGRGGLRTSCGGNALMRLCAICKLGGHGK